MGTSNGGSGRVLRAVVALVIALAPLAVVACSGAPAATPTPTPAPAVATPTPDPHLADPASVDDVYRRLSAAGLRITANTATAGAEPVMRVSATYRDWPLILTQYTSSAALLAAARFDPASPPRRGQAPYRIVGLNILVEYGPSVTNTRTPPIADEQRRTAAIALIEVLDDLLGPLQQSAVDPLPLPGATGTGESGSPNASEKPVTSPAA
ncbi:MAG TPA: hypothetical protein VH720_00125 [Candidatus Limnocylindrales bacterium]